MTGTNPPGPRFDLRRRAVASVVCRMVSTEAPGSRLNSCSQAVQVVGQHHDLEPLAFILQRLEGCAVSTASLLASLMRFSAPARWLYNHSSPSSGPSMLVTKSGYDQLLRHRSLLWRMVRK